MSGTGRGLAGTGSRALRNEPVQPAEASDSVSVSVSDLAEVEDAELRRRRESLERRAMDRQLVEELADHGFTGRKYARLEFDLISYGLGLLPAWIYTGYIFPLARKRGMAVMPTTEEMDDLRADPDIRLELAGLTVARTIVTFRERALVGGRWSFEGGASLTTFFAGATLYAFISEFRRWRSERIKATKQARAAAVYCDETRVNDADPAVEVANTDALWSLVKHLPESQQAIVALKGLGYTAVETAEILNIAEGDPERRVEGVVYRWRQGERKRRCAARGGSGD